MYYSIDYYSFTIPTEKPIEDGMFYEQQDQVIETVVSLFHDIATRQQFTLNWTHETGMRFYQHRLRHDQSHMAVSYGRTNPHLFVELSGYACANFDSRDLLLPLIAATHERCSRIDFAVDIECKTTAKAFIEARANKSFKSSGNKYSPTGETEYIGGRTSERMARVYRYYSPHPRHTLLRVEAEYKGNAAKAAAEHLTTHDLQQTCLSAHKPFGWEHHDWRPDMEQPAKIPYKSYSPANASTVRWLFGDVVTALRKAFKTGLIDQDEWLKFLNKGLKDEN